MARHKRRYILCGHQKKRYKETGVDMDQEKLQQMTFETALARLEEIVGSLESGDRKSVV